MLDEHHPYPTCPNTKAGNAQRTSEESNGPTKNQTQLCAEFWRSLLEPQHNDMCSGAWVQGVLACGVQNRDWHVRVTRRVDWLANAKCHSGMGSLPHRQSLLLPTCSWQDLLRQSPCLVAWNPLLASLCHLHQVQFLGGCFGLICASRQSGLAGSTARQTDFTRRKGPHRIVSKPQTEFSPVCFPQPQKREASTSPKQPEREFSPSLPQWNCPFTTEMVQPQKVTESERLQGQPARPPAPRFASGAP